METSVDNEAAKIIHLVSKNISLAGYVPDQWNEEHSAIVRDFCTHPKIRKLLAYIDIEVGLVLLTHDFPANQQIPNEFQYFIRPAISTQTTVDNIKFGLVSGSSLDSLLRVMGSVYAPKILNTQNWPESVKKDFAGQLHKFMASLTEAAFHAKGQTVLYLPNENIVSAEDAAKDKDLVQRLESTVIHWTRQIKEVVNNQDSTHNSETSGPLEEIAFWSSRTSDLSGISDQLLRQGVKNIVSVLEAAKSDSFLGPFNRLSKLIQTGSMEANDNLQFLSILTSPCERLSRSEPKDIPAILPEILNCIRIIWSISRHYNTEERLTNLLRKVSNEIINRCCHKISLKEIFYGDVVTSIVSLEESINCGVQWKKIYKRVQKLIKNHEPLAKHWDFVDANIFAQIDAFVQRCRDLSEVCQGQIQFARKGEVSKDDGKVIRRPLPSFGGTRGPEIQSAILDIENAFEKFIDKLQNLKYDILDVKATHWHEDFNLFKIGLKDLEIMMQNLMTGAFETIPNVASGVELLEAFNHLAKRPAIKDFVAHKTKDVFMLFIREVDFLKSQFEKLQSSPPLAADEPTYAGAGMWAQGLKARVESDWNILQTSSSFAVPTKESEDARINYEAFLAVLNEYIRHQYSDWMTSLQNPDQASLNVRLDEPLMKRMAVAADAAAVDKNGRKTKMAGRLECNFDHYLLRLFAEVRYWNQFQGTFTIPYIVHDITNQEEKLRVVRENIMLVVREYNQILDDLSIEERRLFQEHTRKLDRRINTGLTKLKWSSKNAHDYYVKECRKHCSQTYAIVCEYKSKLEEIDEACSTIASTLLISLEKNYVYDDGVFESKQSDHRSAVKTKITNIHSKIKITMKDLYQHFSSDPLDAQKEWEKFTKKIDKKIEDALRTTIKKSLQDVFKAIHGDAKLTQEPLFRVFRILNKNGTVSYRPKMEVLEYMVLETCREIIQIIGVIPRLSEVLYAEIEEYRKAIEVKDQPHVLAPSFLDEVKNDKEIQNVIASILNSMKESRKKLENKLNYFDKYKILWEVDKDKYIIRYANQGYQLKQYIADIKEFKKLEMEIHTEELTKNDNCIKTDQSLLKAALIEHCVEFQRKLTKLLNRISEDKLDAILANFAKTTKILMSEPNDLDAYTSNVSLLQQTVSEIPNIENSFIPLEAQYHALKEFEVSVSEEELTKLAYLRTAWGEFQETLKKAEVSLEGSKKTMKKDLQKNVDSFTENVSDLRKETLSSLPFGREFTPDKSVALIEEYKQKLEGIRVKESKLAPGLKIFAIEETDYKELRDIEKEIGFLESVWGIAKEWEDNWNLWKGGVFANLEIAEMESAAANYNKRVAKIGRDVKKWASWQAIKEKVDQFRDTLPLIVDLKNPALRTRHWDELRHTINKSFDPYGKDFTLEKVFSLELHKVAEFIAELSSNANKELAIEDALNNIDNAWKEVIIDIIPFKDQYFKIRSTDDLFTQLEDNQAGLSTMKSSRFYLSFEKQINYWDHTLSHISEVIEITLAVQKQWMYLESIFMGSEDIQKQLPGETKIFMEVNQQYRSIMKRMYEDPNAKRACTFEGTLESLVSMAERLEKIQKSLDEYLETKRQLFPRFYFLSNDDLLEILGQQKDPGQVQKHIKKCFEGIKSLDLKKPGDQGNKFMEVAGMKSPDGEEVSFVANVEAQGPVELWLVEIEKAMIKCLQKLLGQVIFNYKSKKEKWIKDWPGQLLITVGKIIWTGDCTKGLGEVSKGNKNALRRLKKKQISYLSKLADIVRGNLSEIDRNKTVALITMEIHSRDVLERMIKANCSAVTDFDWQMQQRYYFLKDEGEDTYGRCRVRQTNTDIAFGYEYQGNNGRLVVTPLTDRCVLTLTTALHLQRGGNPLGPAGTGKTETVKDLGKNLAKFVVVFNCSDGLDFASIGRMFSGLVQSGGWGCFDEFNRIEVEVLSVVASQILCIMTAIASRQTEFVFEGSNIRCNWTCGIFVTMNPGYAGRTELPDNLKSLMRPIAMMAPDLAMIAEVMLMAEGFRDSRNLAKKTVTLYLLMVQQLSKQDHYDYGLRSLKAVLNCAGQLKRTYPDMNEDLIVLRALRDMNVPKFVKEDYKLFVLLLADLFPSIELPVSDYGKLQTAIEEQIKLESLQPNEALVSKTIQLYESKATRHCNMLVGGTNAGKSTAWKMLAAAKSALCKAGVKPYALVKPTILNPKSVTINELYGAYNLSTMEWTDGVLSSIFRKCAQDERNDEKWILLDGPVDTLWIESMNTVMDDNKTLTLINGDRIAMSNEMSLLFEVQDLSVASPATVSRAGMIYLDVTDLGWRPYVTSWLQKKFNEVEVQEFHQKLFEKYVTPILKLRKKEISELVPVDEFAAVKSLCSLYDFLGTKENGLDKATDPEGFFSISEKWFTFCLIWSIGAAADEKGRLKFDAILRNIEPQFPPLGTCYDFFVDPKAKDYKLWEEKIAKGWRPLKDAEFFNITVPTVDTIRNSYIVGTLVKNGNAVLLVGDTGTGKTVLAASQLEALPPTHSQLVMNFSAATTAASTQDIIEGALEKRAKNKFGPLGGKKMVIFVDDFNMPKKDKFGSQPPLELLRQWVDYEGWYERDKQQWRYVVDIQLLAAMGPPGGGRSQISQRLQSRFHMINSTFPENSQVQRIFETILQPKLSEFGEEIKGMPGPLVQATIKLYQMVALNFLPTPSKCHYLFNMRDIAKIIQGLLQAEKNYVDSKNAILKLWVHEASRVIADRFTSKEDIAQFNKFCDEILLSDFESKWVEIMEECPLGQAGPIFCAFFDAGVSEKIVPYEEVSDFRKLKRYLEEELDNHNIEPGYLPMELVLFQDAITHITRISRVLKQPRGNCMLVGVGGSGRQSLTKLSCWVSQIGVFSIEITKNYRLIEFREDLKKLYLRCGVEGKVTTFLFNDTQLKEESFLEDINNILSSGEIPSLYSSDELPAIMDGIRPHVKAAGIIETSDKMWEYFINRVRKNLHVILAMSPVGNSFRNRCRMYPSLVNCTTIDWFMEWPSEALSEVALRFLDVVDVGEDTKIKLSISKAFAGIHQSVTAASKKMLSQLKRYNYVTPTNYLELVKGYRSMLSQKQKKLVESRDKLSNGLKKIDESKLQVQEMSVALEIKKETVAVSQKDCEELLVFLVSERRIADEQRKQVEADTERITKEEVECTAISESAQAELNEAMPALEKALEEVDKLDKSSISEIKSFNKPPPQVETVLSAVMVYFGLPPDWKTSKKKVSEPDFLKQVQGYNKDAISTGIVAKIKRFVERDDFNQEAVAQVSLAAAALCVWVCAMYTYAKVAKNVAPKKAALKAAQDSLEIKQSSLRTAKKALDEVTAKVADLNNRYKESVDKKNALKKEAEDLETKLQRAAALVNGLSGERSRWEISIDNYKKSLINAVGDSVVGAAFLSYAGPFDTVYREDLVNSWLSKVKTLVLPFSEHFSFGEFLAKPEDVRDWNIKGLPRDAFSTENGIIVTTTRLWPLMIDPQGQANKWIKNLEGTKLKVVSLKMKDFLRELENAIIYGMPYLIQDVEEELDPALEPVLNKSIRRVNNRDVIRLGDKEIDYSPDFKMYITTKLPNPHYTPEVSTKTTIVNFSVKEQGLESQLLGKVVEKEDPSLEVQKSELVLKVAAGKRKLVELEDEILSLLSKAEGSLLDDEVLVTTLQVSKTTSEEVTQQLKVSEEMEIKIDNARNKYRPVSIRASLLYFVLSDLSSVDPMYQFSLDSYMNLFELSIEDSNGTLVSTTTSSQKEVIDKQQQRILEINKYHTYEVYAYTCRALFEKHKLLLSFQMCVNKLMKEDNKINKVEYDFFLKGGIVLDKSDQRPNPCPEWLDAVSWDNITELNKLTNFSGIAGAFEQNPKEWNNWFMESQPEQTHLPGDWENKCDELQKLIILRCLRPDRLGFASSHFVANNLGSNFVEPPPFDLAKVFAGSNSKQPLIFVLSPGVDPSKQCIALAKENNVKIEICSLGQGQNIKATRMIQDGIAEGNWVFLANCHLMLSWMNALEKIIDDIKINKNVNPNFRLWLSSNPSPKFPISVLQNGIKMTTEPPRGLKSNLLRMYSLISTEEFERCEQRSKYSKLLFCLCWFHSILLERRKFKSLGFNIPYDFNDSDFGICENILALYLDEYPEKTPFDAMRYLIAEANYGGRVTDEWDRKLVNVYIQTYFCDEALNIPNFKLSECPEYYIPDDNNDIEAYRNFIRDLPNTDNPAAFGQHSNADITSMIEDTKDLLQTILSLQARVVEDGGLSPSDKVTMLASDLESKVPSTFNLEDIRAKLATRSDPDPLKVVLLQECDRYNKLLSTMKSSLKNLQKGIQGLVVITEELDMVFESLLIGNVPQMWQFCYPSLKSLGSWMRELIARCAQMQVWVDAEMPKVFWLGGLTYPNGLLTALLQTSARKNGVPIDSLTWEFPVLNQEESSISQYPKEGAYIKGLYLEGARWNHENGWLADANNMELFSAMPLVHFKPVDSKKKANKGMYACPLYMYPLRTGTRERPSYMIQVELKSGGAAFGPKYWTKRGTALLLSLSI